MCELSLVFSPPPPPPPPPSGLIGSVKIIEGPLEKVRT